MEALGEEAFKNLEFHHNEIGWGPPSNFVLKEFEGIPFSSFSKSEKLGKFCDLTPEVVQTATTTQSNYYRNQKYGGRIAKIAPKAESAFSVVESKPIVKGTKNRANRYQLHSAFLYKQHASNMNARRYQSRYNANYRPQIIREQSLSIPNTWELINEFRRAKFEKVVQENPGKGEVIMKAGSIFEYNKKYDTILCKTKMPLIQVPYSQIPNYITTVDEHLDQLVSDHPDINVFASDAILSILMTTALSQYPWDLQVIKGNEKILFDISEPLASSYLSVNENALDPPPENDSKSMNHPKKLAREAKLVNFEFSQQAILPNNSITFEKPYPFPKEKVKGGFIYKKYKMSEDITICIRCGVDSYIMGAKQKEVVNKKGKHANIEEKENEDDKEEEKDRGQEAYYVNLKAVNEYDIKRANNWRLVIDKNKSQAASEIGINDNIKLTKWTIQALFADVKYIRIAFISRKKVKTTTEHEILGVSKYSTEELQKIVNFNYPNAWGILKMIVTFLMEQPDGRYHLVKDPNKMIIRLYKNPTTDDEDFD